MSGSTTTQSLYKALPAVDALLKAFSEADGVLLFGKQGESPLAYSLEGVDIPRALVREAANLFLDTCRHSIKDGSARAEDMQLPALTERFVRFVRHKSKPHFRRVLNGTGVVLHTNLGRALLAKEAVDAVVDACGAYSNLEMDLATGQRGSRYSHVEKLICQLTGCEAALVVNNNAAAVLIMLDTLCKGKEVIVSRGQLVEIGGSFRIPEVMEKSGCTLREVGATNRTHLHDYRNAITEDTAALMRVHQSNYRIIGFKGEVALPELVALGKKYTLPVLEDLGSGYLAEFNGPGMQQFAHEEPSVQEIVADGADVVTFSGDKILGGPQAGIIAGKAEYIERIKRNPLNRALRIDKMTLAALEATLRLYLEPELALQKIPTLSMLCASMDVLKKRAQRLKNRLQKTLLPLRSLESGGAALVYLAEGVSKAGGGSFPERTLPTWLVAVELSAVKVEAVRDALLYTRIPLIVRLHDNHLCFDVRTLTDNEVPLVAEMLGEAYAHVLQGEA